MSEVLEPIQQARLRRFRPYPEYKDSGIDWLGEIPAHWEVKRLKHLVQFRGGGTPRKDKIEYWRGNIPWVSPKDMKCSIISDTEDKITPEAVRESATALIPVGAVLLVVRSGILVHSIPVAIAGREVALNQDLKAMIPTSPIASSYLMYLIKGLQRQLLVAWKREGATVESLEVDLLAATSTPLPSRREQHAIAAFLDRETAKIDGLVARKERLIELLQEKRTAVIIRGVTRGLDPNVPMKNSGAEWLGEIPAHWEVKRLKHLVQFRGGGTPRKDNIEYWRGNIPWVSPKDMKCSIISDAEDKITPEAVRDSATGLVPVGAVLLVVRSGILVHSIPVAIAGREVALNQDLKAMIPTSPIASSYLMYLIKGLQRQLLVAWKREGATVESLEVDLIAGTSTPLPSRGEQHAIAAFLDRETAIIDTLVAKVREAIDRLKEFRTALTSAAVTGKIDVREEAS